MKFVIIDPHLKDFSGHQYVYTHALCDELSVRGIATELWANTRALPEALKASARAEACLDDVTGLLLRRRFFCGARAYRRLVAALSVRIGALPGPAVIYAHSLYIFELFALVEALLPLRSQICARQLRVMVGLNFGYRRGSAVETAFLRALYLHWYRAFGRLGPAGILFCDGGGLGGEFGQLYKRQIPFLPPPVHNPMIAPFIESAHAAGSNDTLRVLCAGGARYNKGFDVCVSVIEKILARTDAARIEFCVQADVHARQSARERAATESALRTLERCAALSTRVRLVRGALSTHDYYAMLAQSDVVLFPYRDEAFRTCPSSVFREAMVLGRITLAAAGTTLAAELIRHGLGELVCADLNPETWIHKLIHTLRNPQEHARGVAKFQQDASRLYSASALAEGALAMASSVAHP